MLKETDSIINLKGIGDKSAASLKKAGVESIGELLMHLPLRYEHYAPAEVLSPEMEGRIVSLSAVLATSPLSRRKGRLPILTASAASGQFRLNLVWFHMPYLKNKLRKGEKGERITVPYHITRIHR